MIAVLLFAQLALGHPQDSVLTSYSRLGPLYEAAQVQNPRSAGAHALAAAGAARVSGARAMPDPPIQRGVMD